MGSFFTPQLKQLLLSHGCHFERQGKGDHEIWLGPITQRRFVVDGDIKSRHTANAVLKQAGKFEGRWSSGGGEEAGRLTMRRKAN